MVGPALDRIAEMKKNGIRAVQLTYNLANLSGDGSIEPRNAGITNLGRDTIRRIEAEKLLLDLAHGGARTIEEAIAFAKRPLTISHTGARALYDHPRNVTDAAIRAVADKGGVVGVYFMPYLAADMHPSGRDAARQYRPYRQGRRRGPCLDRNRRRRAPAGDRRRRPAKCAQGL